MAVLDLLFTFMCLNDLKNYGISNAISTLVSHAISEGYITDDGSSVIEITTATIKS